MSISDIVLLIQYVALAVQLLMFAWFIQQSRKRKKEYEVQSKEFAEFLSDKKTEFLNDLHKRKEIFIQNNLRDRIN